MYLFFEVCQMSKVTNRKGCWFKRLGVPYNSFFFIFNECLGSLKYWKTLLVKRQIFLLILSVDVQAFFTLLTRWNLNFRHLLLLYNNGSLKLSHHSMKCTHRMILLIFWFPNLSQISFTEKFQVWSHDCNYTLPKYLSSCFEIF